VSTSAILRPREHKQQRPADPACRALGPFRDGLAMPQLDIEPPEQHTSRRQFDQAIKAERDQADAARAQPEARATGASTTIHPTVNHSSRNVARVSSARGVIDGIAFQRVLHETPTLRNSDMDLRSASHVQ
jgi:hypothetical protein